VKDWVRELYFKRYGEVLGEKRIVPPQFTVEYDQEAASTVDPLSRPEEVSISDEDTPF
jgi:hypothetical protein